MRLRFGPRVVAFGALVACAPHTEAAGEELDDANVAEEAADVGASESDAEALTATLLGNARLSATAVAGARVFFTPRACVSTTHDPAARRASYVFDGCSGPHGLARIRGSVVAEERDDATLTVTGEDLQLGRAVVSFETAVAVAATGVHRELHTTGTASGQTARGRKFTRKSTKVLAWDVGGQCVTATGTTDLTGGRHLRTELVAFERCRAACPTGEVHITNLESGRSVSVTFDGSPHAKVTRASGGTSSLDLSCGLDP